MRRRTRLRDLSPFPAAPLTAALAAALAAGTVLFMAASAAAPAEDDEAAARVDTHVHLGEFGGNSGAVTPEIRTAFRAEAERLLDEDGAVGFGEMLLLHVALQERHSYHWNPPDHPLFLLLAEIAAERGVPIDVHMEASLVEGPMPGNLLRAAPSHNPERLPAAVPAFERLLDHDTNAVFVWQHCGWDNLGTFTPALVRRMLAEHPNLNMALRVEDRAFQVDASGPGDVPMPNRIVDEVGEVAPDWLAVFEEFPDRFVIGSDEFVTPEGSPTTPIASFDGTWSMLESLPSDPAERIGGGNAERIYGLE